MMCGAKYLLMIADARFWFLVMLCCHRRPITPAMQHAEIFELLRCGMLQALVMEPASVGCLDGAMLQSLGEGMRDGVLVGCNRERWWDEGIL